MNVVNGDAAIDASHERCCFLSEVRGIEGRGRNGPQRIVGVEEPCVVYRAFLQIRPRQGRIEQTAQHLPFFSIWVTIAYDFAGLGLRDKSLFKLLFRARIFLQDGPGFRHQFTVRDNGRIICLKVDQVETLLGLDGRQRFASDEFLLFRSRGRELLRGRFERRLLLGGDFLQSLPIVVRVQAESESGRRVPCFFLRPIRSGFVSNVIAIDTLQESKGFVFQPRLQLGKADEVMRITCGNGTSVQRDRQKDLRPWVHRGEQRIAGVSLQVLRRERVSLNGDEKRFKFRQGFRLVVQHFAHAGNPFGVRESQDGVLLVVDNVVAFLFKIFDKVGDLLRVGRCTNDFGRIFLEDLDP